MFRDRRRGERERARRGDEGFEVVAELEGGLTAEDFVVLGMGLRLLFLLARPLSYVPSLLELTIPTGCYVRGEGWLSSVTEHPFSWGLGGVESCLPLPQWRLQGAGHCPH